MPARVQPPAPKNILVVDDDPAQSTLLSKFLGKNGFQVFTAPHPMEAFKMLEVVPFQLIITDLMMPHVDGITFVKQLQEDERYKKIPVIMITAYPSDDLSDKGMRQGVAMTLAKPVELQKLLVLVGFAT